MAKVEKTEVKQEYGIDIVTTILKFAFSLTIVVVKLFKGRSAWSVAWAFVNGKGEELMNQVNTITTAVQDTKPLENELSDVDVPEQRVILKLVDKFLVNLRAALRPKE